MTVKPLLGGRYQFIKTLGSETDDATYLVGDTQTEGHPKCVMKRLALSGKGPRTLRFILVLLRQKAESLQRIGKHKQIPRILAFFEDKEYFCLVEEFIPGRPLSAILKPRRPLTEDVVIQLLQEILKILEVVHSWGVIHRCITPSNIIQRQADGKLVLTGFGIFREISAQGHSPKSLSAQPEIDHRQVYVSLNHLNGERHFNGDIYAVGMIGIQALTGLSSKELVKLRNSWQNNGTAASAHSQWHRYSAVSLDLKLIFDKMIHEDAEQRYQTVTEVLGDLRQLSGENPLGHEISQADGLLDGPKSSGEQSTPPSSDERSPSGGKSSASFQPAQSTNKTTLFATQSTLNHEETEPMEPKRPSLDRRWWLTLISIVAVLGVGILLVLTRIPQRAIASYHKHQGETDFAQGNYNDAIAHYSDALDQYRQGDTYLKRGLAYQNGQQWREAQSDFSQAVQLNPKLGDAYYYRGNIRYQLGDRQGALDDYTEAIVLLPLQSEAALKAYVNRGSVRGDLGDETGAIEDYSIAIQADPSMAAAYLNRCLSRSNLDDHKGAIADCTQAINLTPNSVLAYQNRGLARRRLGDTAGALEDFNIAINLDPEDPDPYYNRGLARLELGDSFGAIDDFSAAINRNPNHAFVYYDRGLVRANIADIPGAIADLRASAKLCLDAGRQGCYEDAQYQISQILEINPDTAQDAITATGQDTIPFDRFGLNRQQNDNRDVNNRGVNNRGVNDSDDDDSDDDDSTVNDSDSNDRRNIGDN
ncbi:MAG: tetratricopeptide repeat protein [Cyanothece sp. SIO2G6]|nr:tetratricopeptide repeat protein [Cyanothece sp. SIO2G6]